MAYRIISTGIYYTFVGGGTTNVNVSTTYSPPVGYIVEACAYVKISLHGSGTATASGAVVRWENGVLYAHFDLVTVTGVSSSQGGTFDINIRLKPRYAYGYQEHNDVIANAEQCSAYRGVPVTKYKIGGSALFCKNPPWSDSIVTNAYKVDGRSIFAKKKCCPTITTSGGSFSYSHYKDSSNTRYYSLGWVPGKTLYDYTWVGSQSGGVTVNQGNLLMSSFNNMKFFYTSPGGSDLDGDSTSVTTLIFRLYRTSSDSNIKVERYYTSNMASIQGGDRTYHNSYLIDTKTLDNTSLNDLEYILFAGIANGGCGDSNGAGGGGACALLAIDTSFMTSDNTYNSLYIYQGSASSSWPIQDARDSDHPNKNLEMWIKYSTGLFNYGSVYESGSLSKILFKHPLDAIYGSMESIGYNHKPTDLYVYRIIQSGPGGAGCERGYVIEAGLAGGGGKGNVVNEAAVGMYAIMSSPGGNPGSSSTASSTSDLNPYTFRFSAGSGSSGGGSSCGTSGASYNNRVERGDLGAGGGKSSGGTTQSAYKYGGGSWFGLFY